MGGGGDDSGPLPQPAELFLLGGGDSGLFRTAGGLVGFLALPPSSGGNEAGRFPRPPRLGLACD